MAVGERFRGGGTRGIARFLADHQHCDAGFDVRREDEPGSGRLRITCLGCGQTVAYRAAGAGELAAGGVGLNGPNGGGPPIVAEPAPPRRASVVAPPPPAPGRAPAAGPPPSPRPGAPGRERAIPPGPSRRLPGWLPVALIGALILGGLAMIAIGLTRSDQEQADSTATAPPVETQPAPAEPGRPEPAPAPAAPSGGGGPSGEEPDLDRRTFVDRFELGVPKRWRTGTAEGAVTIEARGGAAGVRVFFEQGERPRGVLGRAAAAFLAGEHQSAAVGEPKSVRVAGRRAARVRATYPGGEETAYVLSARGYAYLIAERIDRGASAAVEDAAEAAVASFRPR